MNQNNETLLRHCGYRDGLAGNIVFPPEIAEHKAAYLDGYQIGNGDRQYQIRNDRSEPETD